VVALIISFTPFGRNLLKKIRENSSLTSNFYKDIAYGRFAGGMSLMLKSGIGIFQALDMVSRLVNNGPVEAQIKDCKRNIEEGCNFAEALNKSSIFSRLYSRMISVGVKTGDVDKVLDKISNLYERETDRKIQSFISIIEPTLVIILSLVVGIILLSVIFPLLGVMTGID
jgi:type IV pilus assembly protein PilC